MSAYSVYAADTGMLTGVVHYCHLADLAQLLPAGCAAIDGQHDHLSARVDLATRTVVPYQPPAPADDELQTWLWDATAQRWRPVPTLQALRAQRIAPVQAAIDAQEALQARPLREISVALASGQALPPVAVARVAQIDTDIQALRVVRTALATAATEAALAAITWPT